MKICQKGYQRLIFKSDFDYLKKQHLLCDFRNITLSINILNLIRTGPYKLRT